MRGYLFVTVLFLAASVYAQPNDLRVEGRNLLRNGKPFIPLGFVHAGPEQFPRLVELGFNTVALDLAFWDFDPEKLETMTEADVRKALQLDFFDAAQKHGLTVLALFSFHYTPGWLYERFPDARLKKFDGSDGSGGWISMCLDHPGFRDTAAKWLTFAASHLKDHPATLGYILWNEPHLYGDVCYSPHTLAQFRTWLREKYGSVAAINAAWGTNYADFDAVEAPPPRSSTYWFERYDQAPRTEGGDGETGRQGDRETGRRGDQEIPPRPLVSPSPRLPVGVAGTVSWTDWMHFRQDNYAAFFRWETETIHAADPQHPVTAKIVPFDLYSSHAYGAGHNTEKFGFLDAMGFDVYSHLDEDFNNRWKCQFMAQMAGERPVWNNECNFTFCEERGLPSPETWRTTVWQGIARGVNGFWFFHWADGSTVWSMVFPDGELNPSAVTLSEMAQQVKQLEPILTRARPQRGQVAFLHSMSTAFHQTGDYAPGADATTFLQALYRLHVPFDFVTEQQVRDGALDRYRVLCAIGTVNVGDDLLAKIEEFVQRGGYVIANARFAEQDEFGRPREIHPPAWFGVRATTYHRQPREEIGKLELRRPAINHRGEPLDVHVAQTIYSSRPLRVVAASMKLGLPVGAILGPGRFYGNEDLQMAWSCQGRHEETWEDLTSVSFTPPGPPFARGGQERGQVVATFPEWVVSHESGVPGDGTTVPDYQQPGGDGTTVPDYQQPAIVETMHTLYIGRDTCWLGEEWPILVKHFLRNAGVTPPAYARDMAGQEIGDIDLALMDTDRERLLFVSRFPLTVVDDGLGARGDQPSGVYVAYDCYGDIQDALTGEVLPTRSVGFRREVTLSLKPGDVRILIADKQRTPTDWGLEGQQYQNMRQALTQDRPPYQAWQRSPEELWVYDNRIELGIGTHGTSEEHLALMQALGIHLIRHTLYWYNLEKTETPGQYDAEYLKYWDDLVQRVQARSMELLVVVHGNPPGVGWARRRESYERFARFMGEMAARYPTIRFWELWNEMDVGFTDLFGAGVEPPVPMLDRGKYYAEMLKLAYPAIKEANPKAFVLTGGMSDLGDFPRGIYEGGGRDFFDVMNVHTYGVPVEWAVVQRGSGLREIMAEYGDRTRPLWNTEFGIDAGNLVAAWGYPHDGGKEDGPAFDEMHRGQWQGSIQAALDTGLYAKILPYQFHAENERLQDQLNRPEYAEKYLPAGHTINDYGFGLLRADGRTPRPTYEWLKEAQLNRTLREQPQYVTEVEVTPAPAGDPVSYEFERRGNTLVIKNVRVDAYVPTRIRLAGE